MERHEQVIAEVFALYERFGDSDYIGEPVSQIEHMSQAAELAMAEGFDDEVVLAAFFHDIGHICAEDAENMGGFGVVSHERLGADYLRRAGFSERMARLVEYHAPRAHRQNCATDTLPSTNTHTRCSHSTGPASGSTA